jgi:hypothetical protein
MYEAQRPHFVGEPPYNIGDEINFSLRDNPDMPMGYGELFIWENYILQALQRSNTVANLRLGLAGDVMARVIGFREVSNPLPFDMFNEHGQFISDADYVRKYGGS